MTPADLGLALAATPVSLVSGRWVAVAALGWCAVVLFLHWTAGAFACFGDTAYCAEGRDKDGVYRGVLVDRQHRALSDSPFSVAFESRRSANPREVGGFSTDSRGRYCIVWAEERITPSAVLDRRSEVGIDAPWHALNGSARPPGCQAGDHGIPRNRADDLKSSTQFVAVPAVTLPAMALLLLGLVLGGRPAGRYTRTAGLVVTLAGTLLAAALWFA